MNGEFIVWQDVKKKFHNGLYASLSGIAVNEYPKHMFKLMGKKIVTILGSKSFHIWTSM